MFILGIASSMYMHVYCKQSIYIWNLILNVLMYTIKWRKTVKNNYGWWHNSWTSSEHQHFTLLDRHVTFTVAMDICTVIITFDLWGVCCVYQEGLFNKMATPLLRSRKRWRSQTWVPWQQPKNATATSTMTSSTFLEQTYRQSPL